jgi:branched-subunit amino acid transport protein
MSIRIEDLTVVVALGLACWVLRATFVLLVPADRLPAVVAEALHHLAPAALASIIAVEITSAVDMTNPASTLQALGVVVTAATVAILTRSMTWTVLTGIVAVLVVDLVPLG